MIEKIPNGAGGSFGQLRIYLRQPGPWCRNLFMRDQPSILTQLLKPGGGTPINMMYLEFDNSGSGFTPPSYTAADGLSYFTGLSSSPNGDYLRVPILASQIVPMSDQSTYPGGQTITFLAQSQGNVGVNGKSFDSAHNSLLVGGALVSAVDIDDASQDLIYSRGYVTTGQQVLKPPSAQVLQEWGISFYNS